MIGGQAQVSVFKVCITKRRCFPNMQLTPIDPLSTHKFSPQAQTEIPPAENPDFTANPDKIVAQQKNPQFCTK
jgi:hypothetical protein